MIQIIHDIKREQQKLNDTLARYGVSIKIQDFAPRDLTCIGVVTSENDLVKIKVLFKQADVGMTVKSTPLDLDWIPNIYYINVQSDDVEKALVVLERFETSAHDISDYLDNIARQRSGTEKKAKWLAIAFIVVFDMVAAIATFEVVRVEAWDAVIIFSLLTFALLIVTIFFLKHVIKSK